MKKYLTLHFGTLIIFLALITLVERYFDAYYLIFWFGGMIGTLLPDLDQLVYVYLLSPKDLVSQEARVEISKKRYIGTWSRLVSSRRERAKLIFHTAQFNALIILLSVFVRTSSGSLFAHGLVLGFALHLFVDQYIDFKELGNLSKWFEKLQVDLDKDKTRIYLITNCIILLLLGLYF